MNKDNFVQFLDFGEFLDIAMRPHKDAQRCASVINREEFSGVPLKQARNLAVNGWPEGFAKMQIILAKLEAELKFPSQVEIITSQVIGTSPDIGAYMRGEPECMFQIESLPSYDRKFARVHISATVNSNVPETVIFWRGAVAIALIHALEQAGYGTELTMDYSTRNGGNPEALTASSFIALKSAGQPLDANRVTFMLANKASLRRLGFSLAEFYPDKHRNEIGLYSGGGYGNALNMPHPKGADITLGHHGSPVHDQATAAAEVRRLLATLPQLLETSTAEVW